MKAARTTLYDLTTFHVAGLIETRRYFRSQIKYKAKDGKTEKL